MGQHGTTTARSWGIFLTLLLVFGLTLAPAVTLAANPTVVMGSTSVSSGESTTVPVILESAPHGLSRYNLTVSLTGTNVAIIDGARYPGQFGSPEYPVVAEDGSAITLEAADTDRLVEPGATDVVLATLRVTGQSAGEADLSLSIHQLDDDGGSTIDADTTPGSIIVDGDESKPTEDDDSDGDDTDETESERTSDPGSEEGDATDDGATEDATDAPTERSETPDDGAAETASETGSARGDTTEDSVTTATADDDTNRDDTTEEAGSEADGESDSRPQGAITVSYDELDGAMIGLIVGLLLPTLFLVVAIVVIVR